MKKLVTISGLLRCAFLFVFVFVFESKAWGGELISNTYYANLSASLLPTGEGTVYEGKKNTVYVSNNDNKGSAYTSPVIGEVVKMELDVSSADIPFRLDAEDGDGYYFEKWSDGDTRKTNYKKTITTSKTSSPGQGATITAYFLPVTVTGVTPTSITLSPEGKILEDYKKDTETIKFTVANADALADFLENGPVVTSTNGDGEWNVVNANINGNEVTCQVTYLAKSYTKADGSPTDKATLTLTSRGVYYDGYVDERGDLKQSCDLSASFTPKIAAGTSEAVTLRYPNASVSGTASFPVTFIDKGEAITEVVITSDNPGDGKWSVDSKIFTPGEDPNGTINVSYTYTPSNTVLEAGTHKATMKVTTKTGATAEAELTVHIEPTATLKTGTNIITLDAIDGNSVTGTVTFDVAYANKNTYEAALSTEGVDGGTFSLGSFGYDPGSSAPAGTLTLPFTFTSNGTIGDYTVTLTLTLTPSGSSESVVVTLTAQAQKVTNDVASVTYEDGVTVTNHATWEAALQEANEHVNSTLTLLKDISLPTVKTASEVTNTFTLDLNGKTLSATLTNGPLTFIEVVGTGKTLTIKDGVGNGKIEVEGTEFGATAIVVKAGTLFTNGVDIRVIGWDNVVAVAVAENATYNTTNTLLTAGATFEDAEGYSVQPNAYAISTKSNSHVTANGGTFTAEATNGFAYAVNSAGTTSLTGCTCVVRNTSKTARGINISGGKVTATNVTITVAANSETADAIYAATPTGASSEHTFNNIIATVTAPKEVYGVRGMYAPLGTGGTTSFKVSGGTYTISATGSDASKASYGFYANNKAITYTVSDDATITVSGKEGGVYGAFVAGTFTLQDASITAKATGNEVYGLYVSADDDSHVEISNTADIKAQGADNVYAFYINNTTGTINNATLSANGSGSNTYGVYVTDMEKSILTTTNATIATDGTSGDIYAVYVQDNADVAGGTTASLTIESGKYKSDGSADVNVRAVSNKVTINAGYFAHNDNLVAHVPEGRVVAELSETASQRDEGYNYYVGLPQVSSDIVCRNVQQEKYYTTLEEALLQVGADETILMMTNYTLPAGNYILPAGATLLVPYNEYQREAMGATALKTDDQTVPTVNITLTFAPGVNFTLLGNMEISALMGSYQPGAVRGKYGHLFLDDNARIDVESGASFYAWGFVTGDGKIDVKKGGRSYEGFQIGDWPGGSNAATLGMYETNKAFPLTHYFYQNIESTIIYRAGAKAYGSSAVYLSSMDIGIVPIDGVMLIGGKDDNALFLMDDADIGKNVWIQKKYDAANDTIRWVFNSEVSMNAMQIRIDMGNVLGNMQLNTNNFILPLTSNMSITLQSGVLNVTKDAYLMPGVQLHINKGATMFIAPGASLYVVDKDQWLKGIGNEPQGKVYICSPFYSATSGKVYTNAPRSEQRTDNTKLLDAMICVHGTIEVAGNLYTTEGGANICSTKQDAGKIIFTSEPTSTSWMEVISATPKGSGTELARYVLEKNFSVVKYQDNTVTSAQLRNEVEVDGSYYTATTSAKAGDTYFYKEDANGNGQWIKMNDGCLIKEIGNATTNYIRPSKLIQVNNGNTDYTYSKADDATRTFINTEGKTSADACVWWEVTEDKNGYYASDNRFTNYGGYYHYDAKEGYWVPSTVTITWTGEGLPYERGKDKIEYTFHKGLQPEYLEATPTKEYAVWTGWKDANEVTYDREAKLPPAKTDMTYTAVFKTEQFNIVFMNDDGRVIENIKVDRGTVPVCTNTPSSENLSISVTRTVTGWKASSNNETYDLDNLPEVQANEIYTAVWSEKPRKYTARFRNWDNSELYEVDVDYNTAPTYGGKTPQRPTDELYSYTFNGWQIGNTGPVYDSPTSPSPLPLPEITTNTIFTASFTSTMRINFGDKLDIVNFDNGFVINMNGFTSASAGTGWVVEVLRDNGTVVASYDKDDRDDSRLLTVVLPEGKAADNFVKIRVKGLDSQVEGFYEYIVPHVYNSNSNSNLGAVSKENAVIYVKSGTLTVNSDATVGTIYVEPGAELKINSGVTLQVHKLVLRTSKSSSSALTDKGTLKLFDKTIDGVTEKGQVYYSRVVADNTQYYPLAFPFEVDIDKVTFSHGEKATLNKNFGLLKYDAQRRADTGSSSGNWVDVTATEKITPLTTAYQLFSSTKYYAEYYFPVTYTQDATDETVSINYYTKKTGTNTDARYFGWNGICSPYTSTYTSSASTVSPDEAPTISMLMIGKTVTWYEQLSTAKGITLEPATMFFYQAPAAGTLKFGSALEFITPAGASAATARLKAPAAATVETQWVELQYSNQDGKADNANIYLHPDKYTASYDMGYDVTKLSTSGEQPFIWTAMPYGEMAFAAIPDTIAAKGVALTTFTPAAGQMTIAIQENKWMSRLERLYLLDKETNMQIDLLQADYTFLAQEGTIAGRFYLYPIMKAPSQGDIVTDNPTITETEGLVAYGINKNIIVANVPVGCTLRCYDMAGKLVASTTANAEQVMFTVPTEGLYFIHADNGVCKVMVK